jgi:hypothetical protein
MRRLKVFTTATAMAMAMAMASSSFAKNVGATQEIKACEKAVAAGDFSDAVVNGKVAVKLSPHSFKANYCLGNALYKSGSLDDATTALKSAEKVAKSKSEYKSVYELLAQVDTAKKISTNESGQTTGKKVLDFVTTDSCTTSRDVHVNLEFWLKNDHSYHWGPLFLQYAGEPLHSKLNCADGEVICYGAWTSDNSSFWGCGENCKQTSANDNCYACKNGTVNINLTCK